MPNGVRNFPSNCDARIDQGSWCFCSIGTYRLYPMPWTYRVEGSNFPVPWEWCNDVFKMIWQEQAIIDGEPVGCTWAWIDPGPEETGRAIRLLWSKLLPVPIPPATVTAQIEITADNPSPPPAQHVASSAILQVELPQPAIWPGANIDIIGGVPTPVPGKILLTPRRWDWEIGEPI